MCKAKLFCVSGCALPALKAATVILLCSAEPLHIPTVGILMQVLILLGANCQGRWSELQIILGAKSEMGFTGFHSLLPTWYFNARYLVHVSGNSLVTYTVVNLTLLFPLLPANMQELLWSYCPMSL